jgi:signal transduction histidine kinase
MKKPTTTNAGLQNAIIEPGLLFVFRLVLVLQLVLSLVRLDVPFGPSSEGRTENVTRFALPPVDPAVQLLLIKLRQDQQWQPLISIGWMVLLLGYLSWPWLRRYLGRLYLPIALLAVTFFIMGERVLTLWFWAQQTDQQLLAFVINGSSWRLWMGLLLPLVLIAWQYDFRRVIGYLLAVVLFDTLLSGWMFGAADWLNLVREQLPHVTIFTLMGYIVTRMMTGQRQQRQKLAEANLQLAQHAETLEQLTISRERNRLARELHDTLAHTLSAVSVQLEAVDSAWEVQPDKARTLLGKSLAQTRSGLTETRRALHALRASPLDDLGLALAVRTLAESTAKRGGMKLELSIGEIEALPPDVEQQVYRIAQEALMNVFKHSEAQRLRVALGKQNGELVLRIEDDGRGLAVERTQSNGHYGLRGMGERAEIIGATLDVAQAKPHGVVVQLRLPEG